MRVKEGGEITDRIQLDTNAYAVMLGGADRRQLFISISDTHDPNAIRQSPSAAVRVAEVEISGAGVP